MASVAKKITGMLIHNHIADQQQEAVIVFGINSAMYKMLHLSVAALIGILFGKVLHIIVFHLFYQKFRTYAGGHHAKSNIVCFICSCGIAVATLTFWCLCPSFYQVWFMVGFLVISFPIIWILSPVEATNKPLDEDETKVYCKKARIFLSVETVIIVALYFVGLRDIALVGATALFVLAIMLVLGKSNAESRQK